MTSILEKMKSGFRLYDLFDKSPRLLLKKQMANTTILSLSISIVIYALLLWSLADSDILTHSNPMISEDQVPIVESNIDFKNLKIVTPVVISFEDGIGEILLEPEIVSFQKDEMFINEHELDQKLNLLPCHLLNVFEPELLKTLPNSSLCVVAYSYNTNETFIPLGPFTLEIQICGKNTDNIKSYCKSRENVSKNIVKYLNLHIMKYSSNNEWIKLKKEVSMGKQIKIESSIKFTQKYTDSGLAFKSINEETWTSFHEIKHDTLSLENSSNILIKIKLVLNWNARKITVTHQKLPDLVAHLGGQAFLLFICLGWLPKYLNFKAIGYSITKQLIKIKRRKAKPVTINEASQKNCNSFRMVIQDIPFLELCNSRQINDQNFTTTQKEPNVPKQKHFELKGKRVNFATVSQVQLEDSKIDSESTLKQVANKQNMIIEESKALGLNEMSSFIQDKESYMKFTFLDYINLGFLGSFSQDAALHKKNLDKAKFLVEEELDTVRIIKKTREIDILKRILLTNEQLDLLATLKKHYMIFENDTGESQPLNSANPLGQSEEEKKQILRHFKAERKLKSYQYYINLKNSETRSPIEDRLLLIADSYFKI